MNSSALIKDDFIFNDRRVGLIIHLHTFYQNDNPYNCADAFLRILKNTKGIKTYLFVNEKDFTCVLMPQYDNFYWQDAMYNYKMFITGYLGTISCAYKTVRLSNDRRSDYSSYLIDLLTQDLINTELYVFGDAILIDYMNKSYELCKHLIIDNPYEHDTTVGIIVTNPGQYDNNIFNVNRSNMIEIQIEEDNNDNNEEDVVDGNTIDIDFNSIA
ncbi:KM727_gp65-like protein [Aratus pisonii nudivirus]|nr:KM727_gp65-like protein [Aratus pisonii nudivirus]